MHSNRPFSRRSFLKTTAAVSASAPFILPSHIWSAETKPNDQISLGFIGNGTQGRGLLGGFLGKKETRTIAVCDVDTHRRDAAKKQVEDHYAKQNDASYTGCTVYPDFRELILRPEIDAVVIATPDHWHALIAITAAKAGKDIYCEKPLCQSLHEARSMVNAVRSKKRVFQTGSMQRSSREFRVACELVRNGAIGKIKNVDVMVGGPGKPCDLPTEEMEPGLNWDMWLGPAPERGYNSILSPRGVHKTFPDWRNYREYGGGMVTDWGAHHFDIAQWGLGMDDTGPVEIFPADKPNATHGVHFAYANGIEVTHKNGNGIWFYGSEGKILVNRGKFELWRGDQKETKAETKLADELDRVEKSYLADAKTRLYNSKDHKADFISSIHSRKPPICDVEIGARTVSVCHLVNLAYYHGEKMKWDPKAEQFTGGTGNKEWLDVPHRNPWRV